MNYDEATKAIVDMCNKYGPLVKAISRLSEYNRLSYLEWVKSHKHTDLGLCDKVLQYLAKAQVKLMPGDVEYIAQLIQEITLKNGEINGILRH